MSVEFITKDRAAVKHVKALYVSAMDSGLRNGDWALLGQLYLEGDAVRVKVALIPKPYNQQIAAVTARMAAAPKRKAKR